MGTKPDVLQSIEQALAAAEEIIERADSVAAALGERDIAERGLVRQIKQIAKWNAERLRDLRALLKAPAAC